MSTRYKFDNPTGVYTVGWGFGNGARLPTLSFAACVYGFGRKVWEMKMETPLLSIRVWAFPSYALVKTVLSSQDYTTLSTVQSTRISFTNRFSK
jgi:hypothetical protein